MEHLTETGGRLNTTSTTLLVQVKIATLRVGGHSVSSKEGHHGHKMGEECKLYINFQLTMLKGFSCV